MLVRPRDEAEDKHARKYSAPPPSAANLNVPVSLATASRDPRPPNFYQGGIGSCAACAAAKGTEAAYNIHEGIRGMMRARPINPGPLYKAAREKHGWFPTDSGSYIADNLDLLLKGSPLLTANFPYVDSATDQYTGHVWDTESDYELSHQPFYPSAGGFLEHIWNAINLKQPVVLGSSWPDAWFNPIGGRIPAGIRSFPPSGHAYYVFAVVPGFVLCRNSWSPRWSSDAGGFGSFMEPGDFAIPFEYFTKDGPMWEGRVIAPETKFEPDPPPNPDPPPPPPPPDPEPLPPKPRSFNGTLRKVKKGEALITPDGDSGTLLNFVNKRVKVQIIPNTFETGNNPGSIEGSFENHILT